MFFSKAQLLSIHSIIYFLQKYSFTKGFLQKNEKFSFWRCTDILVNNRYRLIKAKFHIDYEKIQKFVLVIAVKNILSLTFF